MSNVDKYKVKWSTRFKKYYKLAIKRGYNISLLDDVIRLIAKGDQQERLIEAFKPIYIVEFEMPVEGELFPRLWRWPLYDKRTNYREAMKYWNTDDQVKRIIEKSMYSGRERILKERN